MPSAPAPPEPWVPPFATLTEAPVPEPVTLYAAAPPACWSALEKASSRLLPWLASALCLSSLDSSLWRFASASASVGLAR